MRRPVLSLFGRMGFIAAVALCAYALAYFLLMARNVPAVSPTGAVRFRSAFRLAPSAGRLGDLSIEASRVTLANYLFYPADLVYYRFAPSQWSLNTLPTQRR